MGQNLPTVLSEWEGWGGGGSLRGSLFFPLYIHHSGSGVQFTEIGNHIQNMLRICGLIQCKITVPARWFRKKFRFSDSDLFVTTEMNMYIYRKLLYTFNNYKFVFIILHTFVIYSCE